MSVVSDDSKSADLQEQVETLREEQESLLLHQEIAILESDLKALRAEGSLFESWGSLVDPLDFLRDDPDFGFRTGASFISQRSDREKGKYRPIFETEAELASIRGAARALYDGFPVAKAAMRNLVSFIIGPGFRFKAMGDLPPLVAAVQGVIDEFILRNRWRGRREPETFWRSRRDGETLIALFPEQDGKARLRLVDPACLTEPADPRAIEEWLGWTEPSDWTFGVHSAADDPERVFGYYVQWSDNPGDFDYLPVERMQHIKTDTVDASVKRGLSDFYAVQSYLSNAGKLDRNVAIGAAVLSAIIGIRQHAPGTTQGQVQSLLSAARLYRKTISGSAGTRNLNIQQLHPGSWLDVGSGMTYHQSPLANQGVGSAFVTIKQALLRTIGSNWCMPEYLISEDASNANYASTLVAESPFIKFCQTQQRWYAPEFAELFWKVLRIACKAGKFQEHGIWVFEDLVAAIDLQVQCPIVEAMDRDKQTNRRKMLHDNAVLSLETWSDEEGYDFAVEQGRRETEPKPVVTAPGTGPEPDKQAAQGVLPESLLEEDEEGRWVTIQGSPVFIDKSGTITKGPERMLGKSGAAPSDAKNAAAKKEKKMEPVWQAEGRGFKAELNYFGAGDLRNNVWSARVVVGKASLPDGTYKYALSWKPPFPGQKPISITGVAKNEEELKAAIHGGMKEMGNKLEAFSKSYKPDRKDIGIRSIQSSGKLIWTQESIDSDHNTRIAAAAQLLWEGYG
jgi:hypothetical protein